MQSMKFTLLGNFENRSTSSAIVVDWLSAGRIASGERWAFNEYQSRFEFIWKQHDAKTRRLVESLSVTSADFQHMSGFDAAVTIFATGPLAEKVECELKKTAHFLGARSGVRVRAQAETDSPDQCNLSLSGKAIMGVTSDGTCTVARLMAEKTEDIYRILHRCLSPLQAHLGVEPYSDRVHGSERVSAVHSLEKNVSRSEERLPRKEADARDTSLSMRQHFRLCQLSDATLPVGGFAHSNGIEAASQMGLLSKWEGDVDSLRHFIYIGALSMLRLQGCFVKAAHKVDSLDEWKELDEDLDAHLAANGVASRASLQQGHGLIRVGRHWCAETESPWPKSGHYATVFGLAAARLDGQPAKSTLS